MEKPDAESKFSTVQEAIANVKLKYNVPIKNRETKTMKHIKVNNRAQNKIKLTQQSGDSCENIQTYENLREMTPTPYQSKTQILGWVRKLKGA